MAKRIEITEQVKQDLIEADKVIKRHLSFNDGCWDSKIFMGVMHHQASGKLWPQAISEDGLSLNAWYGYTTWLKRHACLRYVSRTQKGSGWMVNQSLIEGTEQEIKTTIFDRVTNIASKLAPAEDYSHCYQMLVTLASADPSLTVKELLEFFDKRPGYRALATRQDNAGEETRHIQQELERYGLELAAFRSGYDVDASRPHTQEIRGVNLWQLYRLLQAVEAEPLAKPTAPTASQAQVSLIAPTIAAAEDDGNDDPNRDDTVEAYLEEKTDEEEYADGRPF